MADNIDHIDAATMLDGLEGRLGSEQQKHLRKHLASCKDCAAEFSTYAALLDTLSTPALQEAPESALKKAFNLFQPIETKSQSISEVIKNLLHDSWSGVAASGLRGEWDVRQVGMSTDRYDLHLSIDYAAANMRGQLLAKEEQGFIPEFQAKLLDDLGAEIEASTANEFGEFVLSNTGTARLLALELSDGVNLRFEVPQEVPQGAEK